MLFTLREELEVYRFYKNQITETLAWIILNLKLEMGKFETDSTEIMYLKCFSSNTESFAVGYRVWKNIIFADCSKNLPIK